MPNPLTLPAPAYLNPALIHCMSSSTALLLAKNGSLSWNPSLNSEVTALLHQLKTLPDILPLARRVQHDALTQFEQLTQGITTYATAASPVFPTLPDAVWEQGSTKLYDYSPDTPGTASLALVIPSLINRTSILDLHEDRSLMRFLASCGMHALLVDWGEPGAAETHFTLEHYLTRLADITAWVHDTHNRPLILIGYCMGGLMALAHTQLHPEHIKGLALLATPWDFHAPDVARIPLDPEGVDALSALLQSTPLLPKEAVHAIFYLLHPWAVQDSFRRIASEPDPAERTHLIARAYWANDGIALTQEVAHTCFVEWACHNSTMHGQWQIGTTAITPEHITCPSFIATPAHDFIVPPHSSAPLTQLLPGATSTLCPSGHVGMITGQKAHDHLWLPLAKWVENL